MVKNLDDAANVLTDTLENLTSTQTSRNGDILQLESHLRWLIM